MTTTVRSTLLDATGAPVGFSTVLIELGGVTNGVFSLISGWSSSGELVQSARTVSERADGSWSVDLVPNSDIIPANTVYRVTQQADGRRLYITVPDSTGPLNVQDLLTAQPAQPDATVQGATLSLVDNGDDTFTLTAGGSASVVDNGDDSYTLTVGS